MLSAVESREERRNKSIKSTCQVLFRVKNKRSDIQVVNYIIAFFSPLFFQWGCPWISSLGWISSHFSFILPCWTGSVDATPGSGWRAEGWAIWNLSKTEQTLESWGVSASVEKGFIRNKDNLVHLLGTLPRDLQCIQPAGAVGNSIPAFKQRGRAAKKNCCLILAAANNTVCLHSWKAWEGREGGKKQKRKAEGKEMCHENLKDTK